MKRITKYLALLCCSALIYLPCRAEISPPHFDVIATDDSIKTGDSVYLLVNLKDNAGFGAAQFCLAYEEDKLLLEDASLGALIPSSAITSLHTDITGEINFSIISLADITDSGTVLVSKFKAKEGGTAKIDFKLLAYADCNGITLNATSNDAEIVIASDADGGAGEDVPEALPPQKDTPGKKPGGNAPDRPGFLLDRTDEKTESVETELPKADTPISFTDVHASHWAYKQIHQVAEMRLFSGTGVDTFSPHLPMTRAMFVTVLHRFAGRPEAEKADFSDMEDSWYTDAVSWAAATGIVSGVGNNMFLPHTHITRGEIATILCRYKNGKSTDVQSVNSFHDAASIPPWGRESVAWAIEKGLIMGREGGLLAFSEHATRAETAVIFTRFLNIR